MSMNAEVPARKQPQKIVFVTVTSYVLFCSLLPLIHLLPKRVFGEVLDVLMMTAFVWPYPLLLSLQRFISPNAWQAFVAADLCGLLLVYLLARVLKRIFEGRRTRAGIAYAMALGSWPLLLLMVQGVAALVALCLGWPMGE